MLLFTFVCGIFVGVAISLAFGGWAAKRQAIDRYAPQIAADVAERIIRDQQKKETG